jgi:Fe2+ transport system protein FeoA
MSLSGAKKGTRVVLKDIDWGMRLKKRLTDLGLTPGVEVEILSDTGRGPMMLSVRGTRLALGRGVCDKIFVDLLS